MGSTGKTARGIVSNWLALAFAFAVTFFLSPFVLHRLGNVTYGVWTLVISLTSYMALLDLGLRGAVIRFVAKDHARANHAAANRAISAALWLRQWIGLAILLLSAILSFGINRFFRIPPEMQSAARWAVIITGTTLAISLIFGVFSAVLAALHRFDLISGISMLQTTLRALGVVWLLKSGYGILGLAVWELIVTLFCNSLTLGVCFRVYRELRIRLQLPDMAILREFWQYSSYVFLIHIFGQVINYTDNIVIGAFLSVTAVTFFAIGGSLSEYLRQIVASVTTTFMPLASRFEAAGEQNQLRQLLIQGTRVALLAGLPIQVALFFRGPTFIGLWMGEQYAHISGRVLQIFLIAQIFTVANSTSVNIAFGVAKHRKNALWGGGEAAANLLLSILLVRTIGFYGVAWGTVIPSLCVQLLLWPRHICSIVGMPVRQHILQSWLRPMVAAVPYAVACYLSDRYWPAHRLSELFLQIAAIAPIYVATVALCFRKEISRLIQLRRQRLAAAPTTAVAITAAELAAKQQSEVYQ